jgi:quinohemoprotein ethanol dehydrogenase
MVIYQTQCGGCHGPGAVGGGSGIPDLRYMDEGTHAVFHRILLEGLREPGGMPRFDDLLDREDVRLLQAFILEQAKNASSTGLP